MFHVEHKRGTFVGSGLIPDPSSLCPVFCSTWNKSFPHVLPHKPSEYGTKPAFHTFSTGTGASPQAQQRCFQGPRPIPFSY